MNKTTENKDEVMSNHIDDTLSTSHQSQIWKEHIEDVCRDVCDAQTDEDIRSKLEKEEPANSVETHSKNKEKYAEFAHLIASMLEGTSFGYKDKNNDIFALMLDRIAGTTTVAHLERKYHIPRKTLYRRLKKYLPQRENELLVSDKNKVDSLPDCPLKKKIKYFLNKDNTDILTKPWRQKNNKNYRDWRTLIMSKKNVSESGARWWMHRLIAKAGLSRNCFRETPSSEKECKNLFKEYYRYVKSTSRSKN